MSSEKYFQRLGQFIDAFSKAENCLHLTFHLFAKLDPAVGNVLKRDATSARLSRMIDSLVGLNEFDPVITNDVAECTSQFRLIGEFRNKLIHRGAQLTEAGNYEYSNINSIRAIEDLAVSTFTFDDMEIATADLGRLTLRIFDCIDGTRETRPPEVHDVLMAPWQFKAPVERRNSTSSSGGG